MTSSGNPLQESLDNQGNVNGKTLQEINEIEGKYDNIEIKPGETFNKPKTKTEEAQKKGLTKDDEKIVDEKNDNEDGSLLPYQQKICWVWTKKMKYFSSII